ncbi:MAG: galactoside O-acetyltransferase [Alistipes sp.]|nr:galactoside O-acetyltransferase [Alistipes sp.]
MNETRIDMRAPRQADPEEGIRCAQLCFKINHTMPHTPEYDALIVELFAGGIGRGSMVMPPLTVVRGKSVKIGRNVVIMNNVLMMAAGGITIDDDVMVAANVQLISNNHDLTDHAVLTCKPVHLKRNCWIGAGATILPGVTVGENAVVAAGAVVTRDVEADTVVGGNPARLLRRV